MRANSLGGFGDVRGRLDGLLTPNTLVADVTGDGKDDPIESSTVKSGSFRLDSVWIDRPAP